MQVSKVKKGLKWAEADRKRRLKAPLKIFTGSWFPTYLLYTSNSESGLYAVKDGTHYR
ncbi:hypothetical protein AB434_2454 [Heyndrickxia coagulans]|uniref:Uncharacterized protein n=1 Tax=Heyndrickxia coagulans TaxID=1398 RepID=A0A0C5C5R2_HEYCO|nr:hypothetical protein SB48_HM08orf04543 [Heyndrickxia coagulans]AKN54859.1 hypothetical protein AB434_2454 [Heyndrickxia coagulans]KWZ77064.1 hypothetical protein HMPREF3213_03478 [Heyndrickxia coagulans]